MIGIKPSSTLYLWVDADGMVLGVDAARTDKHTYSVLACDVPDAGQDEHLAFDSGSLTVEADGPEHQHRKRVLAARALEVDLASCEFGRYVLGIARLLGPRAIAAAAYDLPESDLAESESVTPQVDKPKRKKASA